MEGIDKNQGKLEEQEEEQEECQDGQKNRLENPQEDLRESLIIRSRRLEFGISQQNLAVAVGLQIRQYQRFEYGERLVSKASMKQGLRICAALELDPYSLAFGSGPVLCTPLEKSRKAMPQPVLQ